MHLSLADAIATVNVKNKYSEKEFSQTVVALPPVNTMKTDELKGMHVCKH